MFYNLLYDIEAVLFLKTVLIFLVLFRTSFLQWLRPQDVKKQTM